MKIILSGCLLFFCSSLFSQTVTWDGGAGTHNWEDALNWDTDVVPSAAEDVKIFTDSVVINSNTGIKSLAVGDNSTGNYFAQVVLRAGTNLNVYNSDGNGIKIGSQFSTFYNRGSITMDFCDSTGLIVNGTFLSQPNSEITIINCLNGIIIDGSNSKMEISTNAKVTVRTLKDLTGQYTSFTNNGSFKNFGTLHIYDTKSGLKNGGDSFINGVQGLIKLDTTAGINTDTKFINLGKIRMDKITGNGIFISIFPLDSLINKGFIEIKATDIAISQPTGLMFNYDCGRIDIEGNMSGNSAFVNNGIVIQNTKVSNTNTINNNGVFIDQQNIQAIDVHFNNAGLLIKGIKGQLSNDKKEIVVHSEASSTIDIPDKWYSDKNKTMYAGAYDEQDGSFRPIMSALSADTLFFDVLNGVCSKLAYVLVFDNYKCPATVSSVSFTQDVSTDWHNPLNWDTGIAPDQCYKAIIPSSLTCEISANTKARSHALDCENGAVFTTADGVVLDINPN